MRGEVSLAVIDPSGRCLFERTLPAAGALSGAGTREETLAWDGRDRAGRLVPSGCYWLRARGEAGGDAREGRMTWQLPVYVLR
jgi:hypothetical protein